MSLFKKAVSPAPAPAPKPAQPATTATPASGPEEYQWAVIESGRFPGEDVLVVLDPAQLEQARAAHPGLVTYTRSEIDILWPVRDKDELIKAVHKVKKHLGGWLRDIRPRLSTV